MSLEVGDPRRLEQVTQNFASKILELPEARSRVDRALKAAEEALQELKDKHPDVEGVDVDAKLEEAQRELKAAKVAEENIREAQRKVDDLTTIQEAQRKVADLGAAEVNIADFKTKQSELEDAEAKRDKAQSKLAPAAISGTPSNHGMALRKPCQWMVWPSGMSGRTCQPRL